MWVKADEGVETDGNNFVNQWTDLSGNGHHCTTDLITSRPQFASDGIGGMPSIRFDGDDDYFSFPEVTNIRTAFWVVRENAGTNAFNPRRSLLGHSSNTNFLRGAGYNIWDATAAAEVINGSTRLNFTSVNGIYTPIQPQPSLISLVTTGPMSATHFTMYFNVASRNWSGDIAEVILYNEALTADQISSIETYLADKYTPSLLGMQDVNITNQFCDTTICAPTGFASYLWDNGTNESCRTFTTDTDAWVELVDYFGRTHTVQFHVGFPSIPEVPDLTACAGTPATFTMNVVEEDFEIAWSNEITGPSFQSATAGDYSVIVLDNFGCSRTQNFQVSIDDFPNSDPLLPSYTLCTGNSIVPDIPQGNYSFLWNETNSESTWQVESTTALQLIVTNPNGCSVTDNSQLTVLGSAPVITASITGQCANSTIQLAAASEPANFSGWNWYSGDSLIFSGANGFIDLPPAVHDIHLLLQASNGCTAAYDVEHTVYPEPQLSYTVEGSCVNEEITFTAQSNHVLVQTSWIINGIGFTEPTISTTFSTTTSEQITLNATDTKGCTAIATGLFIPLDQPMAGVISTGQCFGNITSFAVEGAPGNAGNIVNYQWHFGDNTGSPVPSPLHYYTAPGSYNGTVLITAANGCSNELSFEVSIFENPQIDFTLSNACINTPFTFEPQILFDGGSPIASYSWQIDNTVNLSGELVDYTFTQTGFHPVSLTVANAAGCSASIQQSIPVYENPTAAFHFYPSISSLENTVDFFDDSEGQNLITEWSFGDGFFSTENNPAHTFPAANTYTVTLTVYNTAGCSDATALSVLPEAPKLDVVVDQFELSPDNRITAFIRNAGNIPVSETSLKWQGGGELEIIELLDSTLIPGAQVSYTFSSNWNGEDFALNYLCVQAEAQNLPLPDVAPDDNTSCQSFESKVLTLYPPFPNPGDDHMIVRFNNATSGDLGLKIYDGSGRLVRDMVDAGVTPGFHHYFVDIRSLIDGRYEVVIEMNGSRRSAGFIKRAQ
jgi:PKD repeat protein